MNFFGICSFWITLLEYPGPAVHVPRIQVITSQKNPSKPWNHEIMVWGCPNYGFLLRCSLRPFSSDTSFRDVPYSPHKITEPSCFPSQFPTPYGPRPEGLPEDSLVFQRWFWWFLWNFMMFHGDIIYIYIPSGKLTVLYGKSPFSMGKSTINHHFPQLCQSLPEG